MKNILINDIEIEVTKKKIKNVHLSVHPPAGRVRLSAPEHMDEEAIRLFVISKLSWIKKHQKRFLTQERQPIREFLSGESHYFMGTRYLLNVIESSEEQRVELRNKKYMDLYVKPGHTMQKRESIVREWYRGELRKLIPDYVRKWESIMDVSVNEWRIKLMKTRWGTCNIQAKRIWLNLELAKKNPRCLEYVVVHEMVHLFERRHNDRFKAYMNKFMPNWRSLRDELNEMSYDSNQWDY